MVLLLVVVILAVLNVARSACLKAQTAAPSPVANTVFLEQLVLAPPSALDPKDLAPVALEDLVALGVLDRIPPRPISSLD